MEWQQILGFYQVARLGSFTRAAEATFRTQSALTQQVKALEEELECRLLERIGRRKVQLTPAGERLFRFAELVVDENRKVREDLKELQGASVGRLKIAAPFTTLYHLLPPVFEAYRREFPLVELSIFDRSQKSVLDLVRAGEVDFGLALESLAPENLAALRWQEVHTVLMVPDDHALAATPRFTLADISRYPLILPPKGPEYQARQRLEELFRKSGLEFQVAMESSNVELSALYVALGVGVSFASVKKDLVGGRRGSLVFLPLTEYVAPEHLAVVMRQDRVLPPYKKGFLSSLEECR
jgi:DNA-binding transcriptional LysR family regulator